MLFDRRRAKDVPLFGERFSASSYRFMLLPPKFTEATEKSDLPKSDSLTEKFPNVVTKGFTGTWIHVFLLSFAEIGKAKVTEQVRGIRHEKYWCFAPFSVTSGAISSKKFYRITLSPFSIFRHVLSKSDQFLRRYPKMSFRLIAISATTIIAADLVRVKDNNLLSMLGSASRLFNINITMMSSERVIPTTAAVCCWNSETRGNN